MSIDNSIRETNQSARKGLDDWRGSNAGPSIDIVGAVGFSEGALVVALMLWLQQEQHRDEQEDLASGYAPLQFAVISCCFFPDNVSLWINARAKAGGKTETLIDVPTLHIHGEHDFGLERARELVHNHYQPEYAIVVQLDIAHRMPTKKEDVAEIVKHSRRLAGIEAT